MKTPEIKIKKRLLHFIVRSVIINLFFNLAQAQASAERERLSLLANSSDWKTQLFYFRNGKSESFVNAKSQFFISDQGKKNPADELEASLKIFLDPSDFLKKGIGHPQCLYPARFRFLKKYLKLETMSVSCPALQDWKDKLKSSQVSIVFATQFVSNPASVMGHTFLKFINNEREDYINQSVGYAADISPHDGPFNFAYKGLTGKYPGHFFTAPIYEKLHEYNNIEQRDIWEIILNLNEEERNHLVELIWELKQNAELSYYFIDENCSYMLMALLQAIRPNNNLTESYGFYVTPYMTLQRLEENSFIASSRFIPSIRRIVLDRYENLNNKKRQRVLEAIKNKSTNSEMLTSSENDTIIEYLLLQKYKAGGKIPLVYDNINRQTLLNRSTQITKPKKFTGFYSSPLQSHAPHFVDYYLGQIKNDLTYHKIKFRPGVHHFMDKDDGFLNNSSFNFFNFEIRHFIKEGDLELSRFSIFDLRNTNSYHPIDPQLSWRLNALSYRRSLLCENCQINELNFYIGSSFEKDQFLFSLMIGAREFISSHLSSGHDNALSFNSEFIFDLHSSKLRFSTDLSHRFTGGYDSLMIDSELEIKLYDVSRHLHLGWMTSYQFFLKGKNVFYDNSLNASYDF